MRAEVIAYLQKKGIKVIYEDVTSRFDNWLSWYRGNVQGFHNYEIYNGQKHLDQKRKSLNMPARVCRDWADLLLNEKVKITVDDEKTQKTVDKLLKQVNFFVRGNNLIEYAYGIGGGYFVQYFDGRKTNQKYIIQNKSFPITYDSGRTTEIAFASEKIIDGEKYIYLETHLLDNNRNYVIDNVLLQKNGDKDYTEVGEDFYKEHGIMQKWKTQSPEPLFQQIRPNVVNRDYFNSAYGVSVFDTALDAFSACDTVFNAYYGEIALGRKRIFAKTSVTQVNYDENGEPVKTFDTDDDVFYFLPGDDEDGNPIIESNMDLRVPALDQALQTQLNIISQLCGFGKGRYKWDDGTITTATQIISNDNQMFRTMKKHELILNDAIIAMTKGLLYIENKFVDGTVKYDVDVTVDFDDSIIEDTAETKRQALQDLSMGIISKAEYFRLTRKLNKEQSEALVKEMSEEQAAEIQQMPVQEEPEGV